MEKVGGTGVPVRGNDIDTDQIIPARFMKCVTFDGLGEYAFYDARYAADGGRKAHPLNDPRFQGASVLLVNKNFGCGSSREHAPQALARVGIKAVIGESFAEIFAGNCTAMGIPTATVSEDQIEKLMGTVEGDPTTALELDIRAKALRAGSEVIGVEMAPAYRSALLADTWDSTALLLSGLDKIKATAERIPYINGFSA